MHEILHAMQHALEDTAKLLPFLLIIYIIIEILEGTTSLSKQKDRLKGPLAPLVGTVTGLVPQCGFSVMAAKLYDRGLIRVGTLLAVFLATSDEALIILLSDGAGATSVLPMILAKLVIALAVGYLANWIIPEEKAPTVRDYFRMQVEMQDETYCSCGGDHTGKSKFEIYFLTPLKHTLKVSLFVFLVNFVFTYGIEEVIGEENFSNALIGGRFFQPVIAALIGLIPNCVSSVILTEAYLMGGITFGSCVAGLCCNAGLGFFVLLKNRGKTKRNILLILATFLISVGYGILLNLIF